MTSKSTLHDDSFAALFDKARDNFEYHMEGYRYDISEQIFQAFEKSGITRADFAKKMNVSKGRISQILGGTSNYTLESLIRISEILDYDLKLFIRPSKREQCTGFTDTLEYSMGNETRRNSAIEIPQQSTAKTESSYLYFVMDIKNAFSPAT